MKRLAPNPFFFIALAVASISACGEVNSNKDVDGGDLIDAAVLVDAALVDAALDPDANFACEPNSIVCADGTRTQCNAAGQVLNEEECIFGCFDDTRCARLNPSNGLAGNLDTAATTLDVVLNGSTTIDTTAGTITDQSGSLALSTDIRVGGPVEVFVLEVKSLIASDITVIGDRALAIVADGDISISGILDVSAQNNRPGAGAMVADNTCQGGQGSVSGARASGGGGGGFGSPGGSGGNAVVVSGGSAGVVNGTPALIPLRGGCRGGNGGANMLNTPTQLSPTDPGAGGGAVQLVSNTVISLSASSAIAAKGGGGKQWTGGLIFCLSNSPCFPSEGAGSGGAILLEAPEVILESGSVLAANGGGGSCGQSNGGSDGNLSDSLADGGDCTSIDGYGSGGQGGAGSQLNGSSGINGTTSSAHGGGGGGGVGRIRINLPLGRSFSPSGLVSPTATTGALETR